MARDIALIKKCLDTGRKPELDTCLQCASFVAGQCIADDWYAQTISEVLYEIAKRISEQAPDNITEARRWN